MKQRPVASPEDIRKQVKTVQVLKEYLPYYGCLAMQEVRHSGTSNVA